MVAETGPSSGSLPHFSPSFSSLSHSLAGFPFSPPWLGLLGRCDGYSLGFSLVVEKTSAAPKWAGDWNLGGTEGRGQAHVLQQHIFFKLIFN